MTLRDILTKALEIIGDGELDLDAESDKRSRLISCGNMIYSELTEEYVRLRHEEILAADRGIVLFSDFAKPVKDVIRIRRNGVKIPFRQFQTHVDCGVHGAVEVEYLYHAPELTLDGEADLPPFFTASALAAGVAAEYFYRSGLTEEALIYKNRYDNSILNLSRRRNSAEVRQRRFI